MPLFKKKQSLQAQRAALGLIPGNPVPLDQYAPVLREVLKTAAVYREPPEIAHELGMGNALLPEQAPAFLSLVTQEFTPLYQGVRRLQDIHPNIPQLLDVHVAATNYLEKFMLAVDRYNVSLRLELQGDSHEAAHMHAEAKRLNGEVIKARNIFAAELRQLNRKDRTLYASLGIPSDHLARLGLV